MDIYYTLVNEVEIDLFIPNRLEIAGKVIINFKHKLEKLLKKWSSLEWQVIIKERDKFCSLKDKMIKKVELMSNYQLIKNNFPDVKILDIILNNYNYDNKI